MQHIHCISNVDEEDEDDQQEVSNVDEGPNDECYVERHIVKEAKPVNDRLCSLTDDHEQAHDALINLTHEAKFTHRADYDPDCAQILNHVDVVVRQFEVLLL